METSPDFEELFALLNSHEAEYLVIGGHAVAFHEKPRYTKDIDIFVRADDTNAARLLAALADFGFDDAGLALSDFTSPGMVIQLGIPPNRVDILTEISGIAFDEAWSGRVEGRYGEVPVHFIGREALIKNKRASGRPQDLIDLAWLTDDESE